jgi:hypothetical protein
LKSQSNITQTVSPRYSSCSMSHTTRLTPHQCLSPLFLLEHTIILYFCVSHLSITVTKYLR